VNYRHLATIVLGCCLTLGCTMHSDFTALSSKNVNLTGIAIKKENSKGISSGKDCQHIISFIPTSGPPTLDEAIDRALEPMRANLMLDAQVDWVSFYIPYVYGQTCWKVKGEVYDSYE